MTLSRAHTSTKADDPAKLLNKRQAEHTQCGDLYDSIPTYKPRVTGYCSAPTSCDHNIE